MFEKESLSYSLTDYNYFIQKLSSKESKMKEKIDTLNEKIKMKEKNEYRICTSFNWTSNCVKTKIYLKQGECTELIVYENG